MKVNKDPHFVELHSAFCDQYGTRKYIRERGPSVEEADYECIAFSYEGDAVIFFSDGRKLSVPGHVAENLLRVRAEEGLPQIPVTRATSPAPGVDNVDIAVPDVTTARQWKVTIACQVDGVTDDPSFPALFDAACASDPEVHIIESCVLNLAHWVSAVLLVSATDMATADAMGLSILKRNLHVAAQAIIGDELYGSALRVGTEPFSSQFN